MGRRLEIEKKIVKEWGRKEKNTSTLYYILVGRGGHQGLVKGLGDLCNKPQTLVVVTEVGLRVEVCYPL